MWPPPVRPREQQHDSETTTASVAQDSTGKNWQRMSWVSQEVPSSIAPENLRKTAAWIRDDLDPLVAREGPQALLLDDVLTIHTLLLALQNVQIGIQALRISRIHLAVAEICGKATRWPAKLADEADRVLAHLEDSYGSLQSIRIPLFENKGRLFGICTAGDNSREVSGMCKSLDLD